MQTDPSGHPGLDSILASPKPFLKWAGGKGQLLGPLLDLLPTVHDSATYFEPFLGAGALFFGLEPKRAVLSDINRPLIDTFGVVRDYPDELLRTLDSLPKTPAPNDYYPLRESFNELLKRGRVSRGERIRLAALFIWLNHTCYNGLYRVNQLGLFNVPFGGAVRPFIFDEAELRASSRALSRAGVVLQAADYRSALKSANSGDVAYLDPPYEPRTATARFTGYTKEGFDSQGQSELLGVVRELRRRGCRVLISNSSTPATKELYAGLKIHTVQARRAINSNGAGRGKVKELIVIG